jgi:hypothetical protein
MRVMFVKGYPRPFIYITFPNGFSYKYEGFELGEFEQYKQQFKHRPGALANLLKQKYPPKKVELNI